MMFIRKWRISWSRLADDPVLADGWVVRNWVENLTIICLDEAILTVEEVGKTQPKLKEAHGLDYMTR